MTKYLYRKTALHRKAKLAMALVVLSLAASFAAQAQYRAPQAERKTPRALGVLETFKNGTRRLVPVTFFYEKHYYDATLYHATPVPFTLYSETLYEVQQYGKVLGSFTVLSATQNPAQDSTEWFGNGRFRLAQDATLLAKKKTAPVVVEDPSRPMLHRRAGSEGDNPPRQTSAAPDAKPGADEDDPDRPKLHRRQGSGDSTGESASTGTASSGSQGNGTGTPSHTEESSGQDPDRPVLHRKNDSGNGTAASASAPSGGSAAGSSPPAPASTTASAGSAGTPTTGGNGTSATGTPAAKQATPEVVAARAELTPSDDPDHPILRRGKPVQEQGGRDLPDFKKEEPVARQVAVSDAGPATATEGQELIYICREPERNHLEASARELAQAELRRLAAQRGLLLAKTDGAVGHAAKGANAAANARSATRAKNVTTAPLPAMTFQEEQFVPYDLDYSNYATVVFSGRYAGNAAGKTQSSGTTTAAKGLTTSKGQQSFAAGHSKTDAAAAAGARGRSWVVTVVAREDSEGKLTKVYSSVSDPRELDLYPEVRLVDAVDPDGYGRQALLFREQKRDGVSWLLGRMVGYNMQTVFETAER